MNMPGIEKSNDIGTAHARISNFKGETNTMNRIVGLLIATVISASLARAADVNVELYMTSTAGASRTQHSRRILRTCSPCLRPGESKVAIKSVAS
jgi:hypothetical protein